MQFAVGLKASGKSEHTVVDAEDALIAALKVKMQDLEPKSCMCVAQISGAMLGTRHTSSKTSKDKTRCRGAESNAKSEGLGGGSSFG
jgi:hypothetical protein